MSERRIAVVTAAIPSSTTLAEYGFHLLTALGGKAGIEVVALVEANHMGSYPPIEGVRYEPGWEFNRLDNAISIVRALRREGAELVLFNTHFTGFGSGKAAAAIGLMAPLLARIAGTPSIVLTHNIVEAVDLDKAGFGSNPILVRAYQAIGYLLTRLLLCANLVTTTIPRYVQILSSKYGARNVALTPHGTFDLPAPPTEPPPNVVMTFGKFGTYKQVEIVIEAVRSLGRPDVQIVVAGSDSPNTPGYLEGVESRLGGPDVSFIGYVAEKDVEELFRSSTCTVFPYNSTTGSSGVLHQAGSYGCAPVLPRIGDLEALIVDEGYTGAFYQAGDVTDLARVIGELLDRPRWREEIAAHNYAAAGGLSMADVTDFHLIHMGQLLNGDPLSLLSAEFGVGRSKAAAPGDSSVVGP